MVTEKTPRLQDIFSKNLHLNRLQELSSSSRSMSSRSESITAPPIRPAFCSFVFFPTETGAQRDNHLESPRTIHDCSPPYPTRAPARPPLHPHRIRNTSKLPSISRSRFSDERDANTNHIGDSDAERSPTNVSDVPVWEGSSNNYRNLFQSRDAFSSFSSETPTPTISLRELLFSRPPSEMSSPTISPWRTTPLAF